MIIKRIKTNHVTNPLGFNLATPRLSWVTEDTSGKAHTQAACPGAGRGGCGVFQNCL